MVGLAELRTKRWANLLVVNLRLYLGFAFVPAGLKKVLGERFTDAANTGTFHEFLHAFHATGLFYRFVGGVQLAVALLLMTQTHATLGALLALPLFVAITALCWSTGALFTAVMTTLMALAALGLATWEHEKWSALLSPSVAPASVAPAPAAPAPVDLRLWRRCGLAVLALYLGSCALTGGIYRPRGLDLGRPEFYVFPLMALLPLATLAWERRSSRLGAALVALVLLGAAGVAVSAQTAAEHPLAAWAGSYRNTAADGGAVDIETAVDAVIADMGPVIRRVARRRILESNPPFRTLNLAYEAERVTLEFVGVRSYSARLGGRAERARAPDGSHVDASFTWRGGRLSEHLEAPEGGSVNVYRLSADGRTLTLRSTMSSSHLPRDITYVLRFRRAAP